MKIHDRKLHVLFFKEYIGKSVKIYEFHQTPIKSVRIERILFTRVSYGKPSKYINCETLKKCFEVNLYHDS